MRATKRIAVALLSAFAMAAVLPAAAIAQSGSAGQEERFTIESKNTDIEKLVELSEKVGRVPGDLINTLVTRDRANASAAVMDFLTRGNAMPRQMAARAIALIRQVREDPRLKTPSEGLQRASIITDTLGRALNAPRIFEVEVDSDYRPFAGAEAYDLGPIDGPRAPGFEALSTGSGRLEGVGAKAFEASGNGALLGDGIQGVESLQLSVPNGVYRVILMANPSDTGNLPPAPFGMQLIANNTAYHMGEALPASWVPGARISRETLPSVSGGGSGSVLSAGASPYGNGIAIAFTVDVVHGFLTLEFRQPRGQRGITLNALVVESADAQSSLVRASEVARARIGGKFASIISQRYANDPDMAAALTALLAHQAPAQAPQVLVANISTNQQAAARIAEVVSRLPNVNVTALRSAIEQEPSLSESTKQAALAAMPPVSGQAGG